MRRGLFTIAAELSVLLLWGRSRGVADAVQYGSSSSRHVVLGTYPGELSVTLMRSGPGAASDYSGGWQFPAAPASLTYSSARAVRRAPMACWSTKREWDVAGVHYWGGRVMWVESREVDVRLWIPAVLFAAVPTLWIVRRVGQPHRPEVCCPACWDDLRATPARCPECGAEAVGRGLADRLSGRSSSPVRVERPLGPVRKLRAGDTRV